MRARGWRGVLLLLAILVGRASLVAQPSPPPVKSSWDLFVAGGKGIFRTAPLCLDLGAFSGSPLLFDFEQDFFLAHAADLVVQTESTSLGFVDGRQIVQIIQKIQSRDSGLTDILKRLLVQRSGEEFCAIYQQIYGAAQVEVKPASLVQIGGVRLLKTMDQNGNAVWNEEYWAFLNGKPTHVDLSRLYQQMSASLPKGTTLANGPFDLSGDCLEWKVWRPTESMQSMRHYRGLRGGQTWIRRRASGRDSRSMVARPFIPSPHL